MFAIPLRKSTAGQTHVIGPFIDDTDFKTVETALTIDANDIVIRKAGAASVFKNSGGATTNSQGMYSVTWDATDTNTEGELFVSVLITGTLIVVAKFFVQSQAVFDALSVAGAPGYGVAQTGDSFVRLGANGVSLSDLGGMSTAMKVEVQVESDLALVGQKLDHLVAVPVGGGDVVDSSIIATMVSKGGPPTWAAFNNTTDSLEALADSVIPSKANIVEILGTGIVETTVGNIAANFDNFYDNADALTTKIVDNVGTVTGSVDANIISILGTAVTEPIGGAGASSLAANFSIFYDVNPTTTQTVDDVGIGGGTVNANLIEILGTAVTEPIGGAGASGLAENFSIFFDVNPTTTQTVDDVGSGGGSFWTTLEQQNIRYRLQMNGDQGVAPTTDAPLQLKTSMGGILNTAIFETTGGNIAANFDNFFDNGDSVTATVILDHVTSQANVQVACDAALVGQKLDHLINVSVGGGDVVDSSIIANMVSKGGPPNWLSFNNTTDSLEAIADSVITFQEIADTVWDEPLAGHVASGTTGEALFNTGGGGVTNVNLVEILGTAITEVSGGGIGELAGNFSKFFDVNPVSTQSIDDVGAGSGGSFWSASERANIRYRLQMDGTQTSPGAPATNGSQMPVNVTHWKGAVADDPLLLGDLFTANQALDTTLGTINSVGDTQAQCNSALVAQNLNFLFTSTYNPASPPGSSTSWANSLVQDKGGGVTQFTLVALELASGSALTLDDIADAVWVEILGVHSAPGNAAEALLNAGAAANPWIDDLSTYTGIQAGKVVKDALTGHVPGIGNPWAITLPGSFTGSQAGKMLATISTDVSNNNSLNNTILQNTIDIKGSGFVVDTHSLPQCITGVSSSLTLDDIADAVWIEVLATHSSAGNAAEALIDASSAANVPTVTQIVDGVWDEVITTGHDVVNSAAVILVSGGNVPSVDQIADAVWTEVLGVHTGVGNAAEALISAGTTAGLIGGQNNISVAEVNAEMLDVLTVDVFGEPGIGTPGESVSLAEKIGMSYKVDINRKDQNATDWDLYNFAGTVIDQNAIITFDGSKTTKAKLTSG